MNDNKTDRIKESISDPIKFSLKIQEIENKAIKLLGEFVENRISSDEIFDELESVREELNKLVDGSEGYPMWLLYFMAFPFYDWKKWYLLRKSYTEHPERFNTAVMQERYYSITRMELDEEFYKMCKYYLSQLNGRGERVK